MSLILNPRSSRAKEFMPQEVRHLLDHGIERDAVRRTVQEETRMLIGQPASNPSKMVESLSLLLAKHDNVERAFLALMHDPSTDDKAHLIVGIDAEGDVEQLMREAGSVAADTSPDGGPVSHDQNYKNLILDYPHQALAFFAPQEAQDIDESVVITPIRQEQLKNRLGDRFHELDVPLLVQWPDGRREALLFVLEEESDPTRFSIHRLVIYSATLAELYRTTRVVPIVIFLRAGRDIPQFLTLGSEHHAYLRFDYLACVLADTPAERWMDSDNLVARLNLPNMRWPPERRIELYAQAIRGLLSLEPDIEKRLKYVDFVDIYAGLDDNERRVYAKRYPQENRNMVGLRERWTQEVTAELSERLRQESLLAVLSRQLERRFGPLDPAVTEQLQKASTPELERWVDNILDARTLDEVFGTH